MVRERKTVPPESRGESELFSGDAFFFFIGEIFGRRHLWDACSAVAGRGERVKPPGAASASFGFSPAALLFLHLSL